jgi:Domain of unknown function (DUF4352)
MEPRACQRAGLAKKPAARAMKALAVIVGAVALIAATRAGSGLPPVGAKQPTAGAQLPTCDASIFAAPGDVEGACRGGDVTIAAADRAHAVALKTITLAVTNVSPIGRIKIGDGSIGPLDPTANTWVAVKVQVKNTSGRTAAVRDAQLNLRLGATRYETAPEASTSVSNALTKASHKIANGKVTTGTVVFELPTSNLGMLTSSPTALLFSGFGGDFAFAQFPSQAVGSICLYK